MLLHDNGYSLKRVHWLQQLFMRCLFVFAVLKLRLTLVMCTLVETIFICCRTPSTHIGCIFFCTLALVSPLHTRFVTVCMHVLPLIMKLNFGDGKILIILHIVFCAP